MVEYKEKDTIMVKVIIIKIIKMGHWRSSIGKRIGVLLFCWS